MTLPPVFIVGTGRCGSTLLSRCLQAHPDVLGLSEVFVFAMDLGGRIAEALPDAPIDGEQLWSILGSAHPRHSLMLRHGLRMDEALYSPGPGRRFTAASGVPALAVTALPMLSDDPDAHLDRLERWIRPFAPAPAGDQYTRLFDAMRDEAGARLWVERSGGSLRAARRLRRHFPQARFVHLVRDGRDAARSMSRHLGFRMAIVAAQLTEILGVDPFESDDRRYVDDVPEDLARFLPERFDASAFRAEELPLAMCGHYWSGEIGAGLEDLEGLGDADLLTLRYEDLLEAPARELQRLFAFLGVGAPFALLDGLAATVRRPATTWRDLPDRARAELERACRAGFDALSA